VELYPILVDNENNAIQFQEKYARKYPVYYDKKEKVAKRLKQQIKLLKFGRMPGLLIIDKEGIIKFAYYGDSMKDIPENDVLIEVIRKLNK
jgi:peroxiredoxin